MRGTELFLVVLAGLLIGAAVCVSVPVYQPYEPEVFEISLENATVIRVYDTEWARGTWFDWDPLYTHAYDFWIIAEPR